MKTRICKVVVLASTAYAMYRMAHWTIGFTFFTQLSNLFAAAVALLQLIPRLDRRLRLTKYAATVSIAITFLVYLLFLAPLVPGGIVAAYAQDHWASLCLHVVTPLSCVADFFISDASLRRWRGRDALWALLPPVLWLIGIRILGQCGLRWHGMAAPYPFLNYAAPAGWFGWMPETASASSPGFGVAYAVALLLVLFIAVGRALLAAARRIQKRSYPRN